MRQISKVIGTFLFVLALSAISYAGTAELTAELRSTIESALAVLNDPALEGRAHDSERRAKLRLLIDKTIDFEEMTKRSLGIHWRGRTEGERREFVGLFSRLP